MAEFRPVTERNIKLGIGQCAVLPGYRLGIALPTMYQCNLYFGQIISDFLDANIISRKMRYHVDLKNGSTIDLFSANGNTRGRRFHELLIDQNIDHEIVWTCLAHMATLQYHAWQHKADLKRIERANITLDQMNERIDRYQIYN